MKQITAAKYIIHFLEKKGIKTITGIPGGSCLPIYDALNGSSIRHVLARHEQGAGFIAQGIARTTKKAGVCFVSSGPGSANLLTAIADADMDSIPMVAIAGQVPSNLIGTDAFQEMDTKNVFYPVTKKVFFIQKAEELIHALPEAFYLAENGRPGPVLIDIPKDIQNQMMDEVYKEINISIRPLFLEHERILEIANRINESKRPVLYTGGGAYHSGAFELLRTFIHKNSIPSVSTLMGLGVISNDDPLFFGMLGMHGKPYTNMLLEEADLILAFGVRFDDRATGKVSEFCPNAEIIHVDIDSYELNKIKKANISLQADLKQFMGQVLPEIQTNRRKDWIEKVYQLKNNFNHSYMPNISLLNPELLIKEIAKIANPDTIITTDVGQHQMWVAQHFPFQYPGQLITSGGLGTMGFGLPAAIGACIANPDRKVICFTGDGSILMNIQELATLSDLNCNLTIIIMNNNGLGLVKQQQELFYNKNYQASGYNNNLDFSAIAKGFGINGYKISSEIYLEEILEEALSFNGPTLIDIMIPSELNVFPMVPPGKANREMIIK